MDSHPSTHLNSIVVYRESIVMEMKSFPMESVLYDLKFDLFPGRSIYLTLFTNEGIATIKVTNTKLVDLELRYVASLVSNTIIQHS